MHFEVPLTQTKRYIFELVLPILVPINKSINAKIASHQKNNNQRRTHHYGIQQDQEQCQKE